MEDAKLDGHEIIFADNEAAHRGPGGKASSLAGNMAGGGRALEQTSESVELGEMENAPESPSKKAEVHLDVRL
jgi:hypothetical protein